MVEDEIEVVAQLRDERLVAQKFDRAAKGAAFQGVGH
jgi:hypothetical protein